MRLDSVIARKHTEQPAEGEQRRPGIQHVIDVHPLPLWLRSPQLGGTVNWVSTASQQGLNRMDVNALLDTVKKTRSLAYDNALADLLGVDKAAVSNWRRGKNLPGIEACAQLADLAGLPVNRVVGVIEEARAHSSAAKAAWRRVAEAACLTIVVLGALARPADVSARQVGAAEFDQSIHYAQWLIRRLRGWLAAFAAAAGLRAARRPVFA